MSLWTCAEHGLYGGQTHCPQCGVSGDWTTPITTPEQRETIDGFETGNTVAPNTPMTEKE
jgi:hypothetical protein